MQIESSKQTNKKNFSKPLNVEKENIVCKDGFCSINNHQENPRLDSNNINLFDPI